MGEDEDSQGEAYDVRGGSEEDCCGAESAVGEGEERDVGNKANPSATSTSLKIKQISLQADRTQSPFPVVAEEATSHAAGTWSVRKTQSLLP